MAEPSSAATATEDVPRQQNGPLVFISHDSRDAAIAEAFSKLLSSVSAGMLKSFRSSDQKGSQGFEYGVEWYPELMKTLESACDVVCLLTAGSLGRPWMLYEAGVAKGKLDIPVHGLALGVPLSQASVGPFAQFQNCGGDVEAVVKLVIQLVRRLPNAEPDPDMVRMQVTTFIERVNEVLSAPSEAAASESSEPEPSTAKLFEEIKLMFQDLPIRLERAVLDDPMRRRVRNSPTIPGLLEEALTISYRGSNSPTVAALVIASLVRDDFPWIYEMAATNYQAAMLHSPHSQRNALLAFAAAVDALGTTSQGRELLVGKSFASDMLLHELPRILRRQLSLLDETPGPRTQDKKN